jgi:protein SCO1/2
MKKLIVLYLFIGFACTPEKLPYYNTAAFTPLWKGEKDFSIDTLHVIAPFEFMDQHHEFVTNKTLKGKIYIANFIFTQCPGICPKMTNHLMKVQESFSDNAQVMIVSHTVMPWADSVERLNEFAKLNQINYNKWRLLTGRQSELYTLARQSYFAEEVAGFTRDSTDFVHTEHCLLVDREGHLRGLYNGTIELEINRMIQDIQLLLKTE